MLTNNIVFPQIMSADEMRNNVEILKKLNDNLEKARDDLDAINKEENLLEWEATQFPQLQHMFTQKEPYDKLWTTALAFHNKSDEWLNGTSYSICHQ